MLVHGKDVSGSFFRELAHALSLNANGALLVLSALVDVGQTILVENQRTRREQECRVAYVGLDTDGKWKVGVEFTHIASEFWEIHFPAGVSSGRP